MVKEENHMEETKKGKRHLLIAIIIIVVLIAAGLIWYFAYKVPQDNAHAEALGNLSRQFLNIMMLSLLIMRKLMSIIRFCPQLKRKMQY